MSKHTPTPWTLGRISKRSQTVYIDAMHPDPELNHKDWSDMVACAGCYDSPDIGISKAEANARMIITAVNYHDRLVEQLKDCLELMEESERRYEQAQEAPNMSDEIQYTRDLLAELLDTKKD